jgi:spore germination protein GerM
MSKIWKIVLVVICFVVAFIVGIRLFSGPEDTWICDNGEWVKHGNPDAAIPTSGCGEQKPDNNQTGTSTETGLQVLSPKSGDKVSSPLQISGTVNGEGWTGFEGQVGTVKLLDETGAEIAFGILKATTEWTTLPTNFESVLNFSSDKEQNGTLVFANENASGLPSRDKTYRIPVKIGMVKSDKMTVKVFFNNTKFDPNLMDCSKVYPVAREIPKTVAVGRASLLELIKGPIEDEKSAGYVSNIINSDVTIQSLVIKDGVAKVDFNEALERAVGGSCRVLAIRSQIMETLKQFSTVKDVVISIDGRTEDILQP